MDKYRCTVCGYIYDPAQGDPDGGIKPGTSFADIYHGVYPFLLGLVGCAVLLFLFPQLALFLPDLFYGK